MTIPDLKEKLAELAVDPVYYSLDGKVMKDCMILGFEESRWVVFYCDENGRPENRRLFHSQEDACRYLYNYFILR
ncbi:MAG TPA: hypothetical protein VD816_03530 [Ohtaekwangia sp.]|nr:hypothetical protein [Ohtaekwangia sp.]